MNNIQNVGARQAVGRVFGQGLRHARRTVKSTESLDKFSKFVVAIFKGLEYLGLDKIYAPLKNVRVSLDGFSKTVGAFNILGRISEAATGFYTDPKNDIFKKTSRGFLFAGHIATTTGWICNLAKLGRFTGHFVANASFRLLPGIAFFADVPIFISAVLGVVASCKSLQRANNNDVRVENGRKPMVATRSIKWEARKSLFEELGKVNPNQEVIRQLQEKYISTRIKLSGEAVRQAAQHKWNQLRNRQANPIRELELTTATRHAEKYQHETIKLENTRRKSVVGIIYDLFKAAIIALAVSAAVFTALTLPFSLAPSFVVLGLLTAGSGLFKALLDGQAQKDQRRYDHFLLRA